MDIPLLKHVDGDELYGDFLPLIESSFGVTFPKNESARIRTFGEFCQVVQSQIPLIESSDCTMQQAFYKLRRTFALYVPGASFVPTTLLTDLLPRSRKHRARLIAAIESELGFPLNIVGLSSLGCGIVICAFLLSVGAFFYHWQAGGIGLLFTFAGVRPLEKLCQSVEVNTVRELVEKITREHYRQVRRNPATVNRQEIVSQLQALFQHELGIERSCLTPTAQL
jgi:hypothetical protein